MISFLQENIVEDVMQDMATKMAPLYARMAPDSYHNQVSEPTRLFLLQKNYHCFFS